MHLADYINMWNIRPLTKGTKISMDRAIVFGTLLYGSVMGHLSLPPTAPWTVSPVLPLQHLRHLLEKTRITSIETVLLNYQLCWTGHISSMENHHLPRIILSSEPSAGHCDREAPKKKYKECLKKPFWCLSHQPSLMVHPSWEPWHLVCHHQPCCLLLWKPLQGCSQKTKGTRGGTAKLNHPSSD